MTVNIKNWQELKKPNALEVKPGNDPKRRATFVAEPLERGVALRRRDPGLVEVSARDEAREEARVDHAERHDVRRRPDRRRIAAEVGSERQREELLHVQVDEGELLAGALGDDLAVAIELDVAVGAHVDEDVDVLLVQPVHGEQQQRVGVVLLAHRLGHRAGGDVRHAAGRERNDHRDGVVGVLGAGDRRHGRDFERLAARSIADLVDWSGGLYNPPARFRSW